MSLTRTVDPTSEPLTVEEVKDHLRIDGNDSDAELSNLIKEARDYVEGVTGRALITQTYELKMDDLSLNIKVPRPPLQSVTSISYQDTDDASQTLGAANYTVDTSSHPGRIVQSATGTYPDTYNDIDAVTITYVAGYGDADDVPGIFKRAMKLYIEKMYDMTTAAYGAALDNALEATLLHHKVDNIAL